MHDLENLAYSWLCKSALVVCFTYKLMWMDPIIEATTCDTARIVLRVTFNKSLCGWLESSFFDLIFGRLSTTETKSGLGWKSLTKEKQQELHNPPEMRRQMPQSQSKQGQPESDCLCCGVGVALLFSVKCECRGFQYLLWPEQRRTSLQDGRSKSRGALREHRTEPDEGHTPQAR